jgi:hypothetical protein
MSAGVTRTNAYSVRDNPIKPTAPQRFIEVTASDRGPYNGLVELMWASRRAMRFGCKCGCSITSIASQQFIDPAGRDRVLTNDSVRALPTEDDRLDQEPRQLHAATSVAVRYHLDMP